jgi:hypothetical protein
MEGNSVRAGSVVRTARTARLWTHCFMLQYTCGRGSLSTRDARTCPTTPTIVKIGPPALRSRVPMGDSPGQIEFAIRSSTMTTGGASASSRSVNVRPASSGIPSVAK